jgi:hypothetical protein
MRLPWAHPPCRPPYAGLLQHNGHSIRTLRAHSASLLPCTHPMPLAPARRARHPASAPTLTAGIPRPRAPHVVNACFKCFRCFIGMFQVFRTNVAKVDHDVAYVAIIVHVCCNLQVSIPNVSSVFSDVCCKCVYFDIAHVSYIRCKCFIWMLHMFAIVCY